MSRWRRSTSPRGRREDGSTVGPGAAQTSPADRHGGAHHPAAAARAHRNYGPPTSHVETAVGRTKDRPARAGTLEAQARVKAEPTLPLAPRRPDETGSGPSCVLSRDAVLHVSPVRVPRGFEAKTFRESRVHRMHSAGYSEQARSARARRGWTRGAGRWRWLFLRSGSHRDRSPRRRCSNWRRGFLDGLGEPQHGRTGPYPGLRG